MVISTSKFISSKIHRLLLFIQTLVLWSCANSLLFNLALEAEGREKLSCQSKTRFPQNAKPICGSASINTFSKHGDEMMV